MTDKPHRAYHFSKGGMWLCGFFLSLCLAALLSISLGAVKFTPQQLWQALLQGESAALSYRIMLYVRLPRTIAAMLAGGALAVSGAIMQAVLNNSLASPNIIGINSGAGFAAILCIVLFPAAYWAFPIAAFAGALCTALLVYGIATKSGASRITIILTGVAVGSVLSAGINTITTFYPDLVIGASSFMMGSLSYVTIDNLSFTSGYIIIGLLAAVLLSYELNVLSFGNDLAASLGLNVKLYRFLLIMIAALLAGAAVSFAGLLGFVGLIVPHMVRALIGSDNRFLVPCSALAGATFVTLCDLLARLIFAPYELPVGIIMSALGGPFFIWLLLHRRGRLDD